MILNILEIIVSVLLVGVILMQVQGTGLSGSFGGTNESFRSRRSIEKSLLYVTIFLSAVFALISILLVLPR
jgi:protein translocase SecG subunit